MRIQILGGSLLFRPCSGDAFTEEFDEPALLELLPSDTSGGIVNNHLDLHASRPRTKLLS